MRVRALLANVNDGNGNSYTVGEEFEMDEARARELASFDAVELLDVEPRPAPVKRRPRKTTS